ncbi:MAG: hypothetical protein RR256_06370, partial [Bacteroidales bacterium]
MSYLFDSISRTGKMRVICCIVCVFMVMPILYGKEPIKEGEERPLDSIQLQGVEVYGLSTHQYGQGVKKISISNTQL